MGVVHQEVTGGGALGAPDLPGSWRSAGQAPLNERIMRLCLKPGARWSPRSLKVHLELNALQAFHGPEIYPNSDNIFPYLPCKQDSQNTVPDIINMDHEM